MAGRRARTGAGAHARVSHCPSRLILSCSIQAHIMTGLQIIRSSPTVMAGNRPVLCFDGLRLMLPRIRMFSFVGGCRVRSEPRRFRSFTVKAATVIAPKYTSEKPLGDRVLDKIKSSKEKTTGGILLLITAQTKPRAGEVVASRDEMLRRSGRIGLLCVW